MHKNFLKETINYTGEQLSSLWIYQNTRLCGDAIVSFVGAADVRDKMVDLEDVMKKEFIYSEKMLHFLIEHFENDLEKAVLRQRMLMVIIKDTLAIHIANNNLKVDHIRREGDDLYIDNKKLSVSIATSSPVSSLIHVGLNVSSNNTPVATFGLEEILSENDIINFANNIMDAYATELADIKKAKCKVKGVY